MVDLKEKEKKSPEKILNNKAIYRLCVCVWVWMCVNNFTTVVDLMIEIALMIVR